MQVRSAYLPINYGDEIPPYAILSHVWGPTSSAEVSFHDVITGQGKIRSGYGKLLWISQQAARDGLEWFWVDTCCINRQSNAELAEAVNSMFHWFRNSTKCYVYPPDVMTSQECSKGSLWKIGTVYSVDNKCLSWAANRKTTMEEDIVYCLGILDFNTFPVYGEGKEKAMRRLDVK
ncbi:hypothetical protein EJ05DRAFT_525300 [Pseudovirgaria hyperparasitica]|uniref:Heterokaryon incompatibility domain-containing protein n=1 Tax=Pseudovirgaria hyperparasitica TaxID=470096 RepID=A0A6A6WE93_9PEZI|nr:uncharacterized protein EJ05DRAFT_525300 [Pseudovirgaria hyperparasitica]KAF2760196.1 hypothetical protein EJ05DRAFT_525300 [Pseudovirgaria hyperparasitica]